MKSSWLGGLSFVSCLMKSEKNVSTDTSELLASLIAMFSGMMIFSAMINKNQKSSFLSSTSLTAFWTQRFSRFRGCIWFPDENVIC